jgi:dCMP deaminase
MVPSWDQYFLRLLPHIAARSKDPDTQVGCIAVGPDHEIRTSGYNGFPRGIKDLDPDRWERPAKYLRCEHAERNTFYNAARCGIALEGCTLYITLYPCMDCARAIIQVGITRVVCDRAACDARGVDTKWNFDISLATLKEAGVRVEAIHA